MPNRKQLTNPDGAHLSESNFRRFEQVLKGFAENFPKPFTFTSLSLAPTTAVGRVRDAGNALIRGKFETKIDIPTFSKAWKQSVVCIEPGTQNVTIKPAPHVALELDVVLPQDEAFLSYGTRLEAPTAAQLKALSYMHATGAFKGKPSLIIGPLPADWQTQIYPNVVVEPVEGQENHFLML